MQRVDVKIVNLSCHELPSYTTDGASGMDIRAFLSEPVTLEPLERYLFPTGLYLELPEGFEAQVRPRSGLSINKGITCLNSPGTIDSDYRGELKVILVNLGNTPQVIQNGDRIAQIVIARTIQAGWIQVQQLNVTSRGENGFGHTGES